MIEPTREQERTAEAICEAHGGWAACEPPSFPAGIVATFVAGQREPFLINRDGSYIGPDNRLHQPEEE